MTLEQRQQALGADVHVEERELRAVAARLGQVRDPAGGQVVHGHHPVALGQQAVAQVRSDEARPTGDQRRRHASTNEGSAPTPSEVRSPQGQARGAGDRDHRAIVGAEIDRWEQDPDPGTFAGVLHPLPEPRVRHDAAAQQDGLHATLGRRRHRLRDLHVDDRLLEGGREVGGVDLPACGALVLHVPDDRGLQPREREVQVPGRRHRARERDRPGIAGPREGVERRPAREPEAEEPRDLVEGLARRIVHGLAEELVAVPRRHVHEHRVPARDHQADRGRQVGAVLDRVRVRCGPRDGSRRRTARPSTGRPPSPRPPRRAAPRSARGRP